MKANQFKIWVCSVIFILLGQLLSCSGSKDHITQPPAINEQITDSISNTSFDTRYREKYGINYKNMIVGNLAPSVPLAPSKAPMSLDINWKSEMLEHVDVSNRFTSLDEPTVYIDAISYDHTLPNNRVINVLPSSLQFTPAESGSDMQATAFAIFQISIAGYNGQPTLGLWWSVNDPTIIEENVYVGLVNFEKEHWDWYGGKEAEIYDGVLTVNSLEQYTSDANASMIVAIAITPSITMTLDGLEVGAPELRGYGGVNEPEMTEGDANTPPFYTEGGELPGSFRLNGDGFPYVGNQGTYPTCTGWAIAHGAMAYQLWKNVIDCPVLAYFDPEANELSGPYLWAHTDSYENCDKGVSINNALVEAKTNGTCLLRSYPRPVCEDPDFDNPNKKAEAARFKISKAGRISPTVQNIKTQLVVYQLPVIIAIWPDIKFQTWDSDVWTWSGAPLRDENLNPISHAVVIVGYDDERGAFLVRNSWGQQWGWQPPTPETETQKFRGCFWMSYANLSNGAVLCAYILADTFDGLINGEVVSDEDGIPAILPPTNLVASKGSEENEIMLTWDAAPTADGYRIYRDNPNDSSNNPVFISQTPITSWTDSSSAVQDGLTHTYWVKSVDHLGGGFQHFERISQVCALDWGFIYPSVSIQELIPDQGEAGEVIDMAVNVSGPGGLEYYWEFPAGMCNLTTSTLKNPQLVLDQPGNYTDVYVNVSSPASGSSDEKYFSFNVLDTNNPPYAQIECSPVAGSPPMSVTFDASESTDPDVGDEGNLSYEFDWDGDGVTDLFAGNDPGPHEHNYTVSGIYDAAVTVSDGQDYSTAAVRLYLKSNGATLWKHSYGGEFHDEGRAGAGSSDHYFIAGQTNSFQSSDYGSDGLIAKISTEGSLVNAWQFGTSYFDEFFDIAYFYENLEHRYILVGQARGSGDSRALIICIDEDCNILWQKTWGESGDDIAKCCAVDNTGNVVIGINTTSYGSTGDIAVLKLSTSTGGHIWNKVLTGNGEDIINDLQVRSGIIAIVGSSNTFDSTGDGFAVALDIADGTILGQRRLTSTGTEQLTKCTFDQYGSLVCVGEGNGPGSSSFDGILCKLSPDLLSLSDFAYIGTASTDSLTGVEVDEDNYITGFGSWFNSDNLDSMLFQVTPELDRVWCKVLSTGAADRANSITWLGDKALLLLRGANNSGDFILDTEIAWRTGSVAYLPISFSSTTGSTNTLNYSGLLQAIAPIQDSGGGEIDAVVRLYDFN